jgi:hypothetical protein
VKTLSRALSIVVWLLASTLAFGQFEPDSAHVFLYFPQLADGGDRNQSWETSFVLHNSNNFYSVNCQIEIYDDNGRPLKLDLGNGAAGTHTVLIPPLGRRTLRSRIASSSIQTGWAVAVCPLPIQGTVLFRAIENGRPVVDVSAPAVPPSRRFRSPANADLGIALANVYSSDSISIRVAAFDNDGAQAGSTVISLCGLCHTSINLRKLLPGLRSGFEGSVMIQAENPAAVFVAWTLNSDRGLLSSLPSGGLGWPASHWERIWLAFQKVLNGMRLFYPNLDLSNVRLVISQEPVVNARAFPNGTVEVTLALSQLISDSPSELAFVLAHELGHIVQFKTARPQLRPDNLELDADALGTLFLLSAGYDPYAGSGAFGKLMMASRRTGLLAQLFDDLSDPHTSFTNRIGQLMGLLDTVCGLQEARQFCSEFKSFIHPNLPSGLPLSNPGRAVPE